MLGVIERAEKTRMVNKGIKMYNIGSDIRFKGIEPFRTKVLLSSPTMHGEEWRYIKEAYDSGWMTTVGENIDELERAICKKVGVNCAVALTCGTAALHLAVKLAAEKLYGSRSGISTPLGLGEGGALKGVRVFCSDLTFGATVNPIVYEGGEPIFIDSEYSTWNMDADALEMAFQRYSDVKLIVLAHLYGTPGNIDAIRAIADRYGAYIVEDAAESFGATYTGCQTGTLGDCAVLSFNGNKIITGSSGGVLLTDDYESASRIRKWSTQSREAAPWYQHEELGYNYRISNLIAGVVRGQMLYLDTHISKKKEIYKRYKKGLADLPVSMNPYDNSHSVPNFWLSCLLIDKDSMCQTLRSDKEAIYQLEEGRSCPAEILEALSSFHAEGRPIWKPMHMQPIFRSNEFVTVHGSGRGVSNAYVSEEMAGDVGADIFHRGLCLPSDIKMTEEEQDVIIDIIKRCFL